MPIILTQHLYSQPQRDTLSGEISVFGLTKHADIICRDPNEFFWMFFHTDMNGISASDFRQNLQGQH